MSRARQQGFLPLLRLSIGSVSSASCVPEPHNQVRLAVHGAHSSTMFAVYGTGHVKELTELVPGILNQLGPDSLAK